MWFKFLYNFKYSTTSKDIYNNILLGFSNLEKHEKFIKKS